MCRETCLIFAWLITNAWLVHLSYSDNIGWMEESLKRWKGKRRIGESAQKWIKKLRTRAGQGNWLVNRERVAMIAGRGEIYHKVWFWMGKSMREKRGSLSVARSLEVWPNQNDTCEGGKQKSCIKSPPSPISLLKAVFFSILSRVESFRSHSLPSPSPLICLFLSFFSGSDVRVKLYKWTLSSRFKLRRRMKEPRTRAGREKGRCAMALRGQDQDQKLEQQIRPPTLTTSGSDLSVSPPLLFLPLLPSPLLCFFLTFWGFCFSFFHFQTLPLNNFYFWHQVAQKSSPFSSGFVASSPLTFLPLLTMNIK